MSTSTDDGGPPPTLPPRFIRAAPVESRLVRAGLIVVGTASLGVGLVGLVVPLLPATPFLLLAAACYARSSRRLHAWLVERSQVGAAIAQWQSTGTIPPAARRQALAGVGLSFGASVILVEELLVRVLIAAVGVAVAAIIHRLPTRA